MSEIPKKVAILLPSLKFGGGERVTLNLAKEMKRRGISVDILVMSKEGEFLTEAENSFGVHDLRCNRTYKLPYRLLEYVFLNRPDVVISSFWKLNLCACLTRLFFPFFKLILWEHSPPSKTPLSPTWLYALSASLLYPFSSKIVAVSNGVRDDIRRHTVGLSGKLNTIYNPITPPENDLVKCYPLKNGSPFQIISVGRLEPQKNPELLIEAFALCAKKINANLLIVGDGSLRTTLENLCVDLGIKNRVNFFGFSANPYALIIDSDLFVLSSDYEGMGNVIVEALHCGLPIVSTDCPSGPRELLMDGKYGSLVPVNDKFALAVAIEYELKNRRSPETQKSAAQKFLPSVIAKQFLDLMT